MPEREPSELFQIDGQDEKEGTTQLTCSNNLVNLFLVDQSRPFPMLLDVVQALMRRSGSGALAGTLLTFAVKYRLVSRPGLPQCLVEAHFFVYAVQLGPPAPN